MQKNSLSKDTKIKELRTELSSLRRKRDEIILEKGLLAQDNKDLRENAAYIEYEQKEHAITSKIHAIMNEIYELSKRKQ